MRYVAVDLGDRRTGLAVEEHDPDAIVVGLPVNMDGTEGDRAKIARVFGAALQERTGRPVEYQDERLTSFSAEQTLARSGRTHKQKKQIRDAPGRYRPARERGQIPPRSGVRGRTNRVSGNRLPSTPLRDGCADESFGREKAQKTQNRISLVHHQRIERTRNNPFAPLVPFCGPLSKR